MRKPDLTVKIYFVEYGYQIDFFEDGTQIASETRDYAGDYNIPFLKANAIQSIAKAIRIEPSTKKEGSVMFVKDRAYLERKVDGIKQAIDGTRAALKGFEKYNPSNTRAIVAHQSYIASCEDALVKALAELETFSG